MKNYLLNILLDVVPQTIETESLFRSSGKIYVVVGILTIIFTLISIYLIRLDSKITRLEKELK
ncbi:MAG: CcmD family protein [bacterium]|nr:CcmD family protein [bacterium]